MQMKTVISVFLFFSVFVYGQGDFNLEDLNPNSDSFGEIIGPDDYLGDICIVFFGHEY
tara:strand:+ start:449 stop:622 length:174 start_codon:yes stop_codon:yes gene_type:complete